MLKYSTLQTHVVPVDLSTDEDIKLRRAFGRFAQKQDRLDGEKIVESHYSYNRCFLCDCRPDAAAPKLFLVAGTHIRREAEDKGTPHRDDCDFTRDSEEQKRLVRTYRRPPQDYNLNLVRNFSDGPSEPGRTARITSKRSRPTLANTLCSILHKAGLDRFFSETPLRGNRERQIDDMLDAAQFFTLRNEQPLADWLATSLSGFYSLKNRLEQAEWERPHGLFIETFNEIKDNVLYPSLQKYKPVPITGRLDIFGEGKNLNRPPYLVIGLLTHPSRDATKVELVRAYAHPCVAWDRLTLIDSDLERDTLKLLIDCRDKLASQYKISMAIEKPLFDKGPPEGENPREICKPDFILRCRGPNVINPIIVIETMGYKDEVYRERKKRMKPLFETISAGSRPVPVIEHDRFEKDKSDQECDDDFIQKVAAAINPVFH